MSREADPPDAPAAESQAARRPRRPPPLCERELAFCAEYVRDRNATRAALAAGLTANPASAAQLGYRLLRKVQVREFIQAATEAVAARYRLDLEAVLAELALVALSDVGEYALTPDGRVEVAAGGHPAARRAVRRVRVTDARTKDTRPDGTTRRRRMTVVEIELHDKLAALRLLYDHFRQLVPKATVTPADADRQTAGTALQARLAAILQVSQTHPGRADGCETAVA